MKELVSMIIAYEMCDIAPINGVPYFIDAEYPWQVCVGEDSDSEDGRGYELFPSVEAALKGFMIDGKPIIDYHPTITKGKIPEPVPIVN